MAEAVLDAERLTSEQLLAQIEQEQNLKKMLDNSASELQTTIADMEEQHRGLDDEGSEWKTRYETQVEINNRLNWQVDDLKRKTQMKSYLGAAGIKDLNEISGTQLRTMVKQLEKDKSGVNSQLRNLDWRLDQESKALHKALDKRKKYQLEIAEASYNLSSYQRLQKSDEIKKYQLGQTRAALNNRKLNQK